MKIEKTKKPEENWRKCTQCGFYDTNNICSNCGKKFPKSIWRPKKIILNFQFLIYFLTFFFQSKIFITKLLENQTRKKIEDSIKFFLIMFGIYFVVGYKFGSPIQALTYYDVLIELDSNQIESFQKIFIPELYPEFYIDSSKSDIKPSEAILKIIEYQHSHNILSEEYSDTDYWERRHPGSSNLSKRVKAIAGSILAKDVSLYLKNNKHQELSNEFEKVSETNESLMIYAKIIYKALTPFLFLLQGFLIHYILNKKRLRTRIETYCILMYFMGSVLVIAGVVESLVWNITQNEASSIFILGVLAIFLLPWQFRLFKLTHGASYIRTFFAFALPTFISSLLSSIFVLGSLSL